MSNKKASDHPGRDGLGPKDLCVPGKTPLGSKNNIGGSVGIRDNPHTWTALDERAIHGRV